MDASKKQFMYIKNGQVLREQQGLKAKVEHEADELFKEILGENKPDKLSVTKNDDEISQLLNDVCNVFRKGPLTSKPKEEIHSGNSCSYGISKVHGLDESARETKCHTGKTEVADVEYETSVSSATCASHTKKRKTESSPDNSRKYGYSISKVGASAESAGQAKFRIGKTEVAKAGFEATVSGGASVSHTKERKIESSSDNSRKYSYSMAKVGASAESAGQAKFRIGETEGAKAGYEASVSGAASVSHTKERKMESSPDNSGKYSYGILKVGASAESAGQAKFRMGETEVANAGYEASVSGGASVSHTKERKIESSSDNSRKYSYGMSKVEASAESAGQAKFRIGETEVAKAGYETSVSGAASISYTKERKLESSPDNSHKYSYGMSKVGTSAESAGQAKFRMGETEVAKAGYEASVSGGASISHTKERKIESSSDNSRKYSYGMSKVEASAESAGQAKFRIGETEVAKAGYETSVSGAASISYTKERKLESSPDNSHKYSYGMSKVGASAESAGQAKFRMGETEVAKAGYEASVSGGASISHTKERKIESSSDNSRKYSYGMSKVEASAESAGQAKFRIGETEVAKAGYETSVSSAASISYTKERKLESSPDNSHKYSYGMSKVEASAESAGQAKFRIGETEVAKAGYETSVSGAASISYTKERKLKSSPDNSHKYSYGMSKVGTSAESAGQAKFRIGETEVAKAGYETSVSGAASISYTKEKKLESSPDNSHKYSYSMAKVGASAESAGKAKLQIGETEVAKAGYEASVSGAASISHTKEKKVESSLDNSYKYSSTTSKVEALCELKGESQGEVTIGRGKNKVGANYSGRLNLQGNAGVSATKMQKEWRAKNGECKGSVKVGEAKVIAQAKAEMHGKVGIDGSKKSGIEVELQTKAACNAEVVGLCGEADLAVRKKEKMGFHVPGAEIICGKGQAEATAKFDFKSNKFGDKNGQAKAKVKVAGVGARTLGVDVQAEEECTKLEAGLDVRMVDVKAGNAKVVGRKKGADVGMEAKVRGFELNALNAEVTGVDNSTKTKVETETGMFANIGNVQVTGLGSTGTHCKGDARVGVSVGNVAVGISRKTGIETPNLQKAYGNVNLLLGRPSLPSFSIGDNFNIGIPFFSAGGGSGGGGGNDGTTPKQTDPRNVPGKQSGEASGCGYKSANGEYNTTAQGGNVNNSRGHAEPSAGMDHNAGQRGTYRNCDYESRSDSHTGPQTVTDGKSGGVYGYGYVTASDEGIYSGAAHEERVDHGTGYTLDISAGIDHDGSQEGDDANGHYRSRSGWQTGAQNVTDELSGGEYGHRYGSASDEGVYSEARQKGRVAECGSGLTATVNRGTDHDASRNGTYGNSQYEIRCESHAGAHPGAAYGYRYGSANNGAEYSKLTQQENDKCRASYTIAANGGIDHDASQKGSSGSHGSMRGEGVYTQIEQAENFTQNDAGRTIAGNGRGVDRDASQPGNNGSFLHGNDTELIGVDRVNTAGYGLASKNYAIDSETGGLSGVQIVEGSSATHSSDIQTQATGYGDNENCGVNNAPADQKSKHTYMERLMVLADKKMAKKFVGHADLSAGMLHDAGQIGSYGNCDYESRSGSHTGPQTVTDEKSGGVYGYGYVTASDEGIYSGAAQEESVDHGASYTVDISAGIDQDASHEGDDANGHYRSRSGWQTGPQTVTDEKSGGVYGYGYGTASDQGVHRGAAQEERVVEHGEGYTVDVSADIGHDGSQKGSSGSHGSMRGVNNASTDHRNEHTYMERLMVLTDKKMAKEFGENTAPSKRRNEAKSSPSSDSIDKDQIKKYLMKRYTPASCSGSGKTNQRSTTEEADRVMYSPEDEKHSKPRKKVPPKKPFGEKKNIHTIFTLSEGDTRPIKHIKGNIVCFGDE